MAATQALPKLPFNDDDDDNNNDYEDSDEQVVNAVTQKYGSDYEEEEEEEPADSNYNPFEDENDENNTPPPPPNMDDDIAHSMPKVAQQINESHTSSATTPEPPKLYPMDDRQTSGPHLSRSPMTGPPPAPKSLSKHSSIPPPPPSSKALPDTPKKLQSSMSYQTIPTMPPPPPSYSMSSPMSYNASDPSIVSNKPESPKKKDSKTRKIWIPK
eukprot:464632_1